MGLCYIQSQFHNFYDDIRVSSKIHWAICYQVFAIDYSPLYARSKCPVLDVRGVLKTHTSDKRWSDNMFINDDNSHLITSQFYGILLDSTTKIVGLNMHYNISNISSVFIIWIVMEELYVGVFVFMSNCVLLNEKIELSMFTQKGNSVACKNSNNPFSISRVGLWSNH